MRDARRHIQDTRRGPVNQRTAPTSLNSDTRASTGAAPSTSQSFAVTRELGGAPDWAPVNDEREDMRAYRRPPGRRFAARSPGSDGQSGSGDSIGRREDAYTASGSSLTDADDAYSTRSPVSEDYRQAASAGRSPVASERPSSSYESLESFDPNRHGRRAPEGRRVWWGGPNEHGSLPWAPSVPRSSARSSLRGTQGRSSPCSSTGSVPSQSGSPSLGSAYPPPSR